MNDRINKWFEFNNVRRFSSSAEYFEEEPSNLPLENILQIDPNNQKQFTKDLFSSNDLDINQVLNDISIAVRSYQQFQDLLGYVDQENVDIINRHYCYYESLNYLRESIISWVDKNILASIALLRPFMELSLLHIYWFQKCEYTSYNKYYEWLEGKKGKPPFKNLLDMIFKSLELPENFDHKRVNIIKEILTNIYSYLCNYNHTPKVKDSMTILGVSGNNITPFGFFSFSTQLSFLLKQLNYLYVLVYPYSLYPFNQIEYLGFDHTINIFFDDINFKILQKYLGRNNIQKLRNCFDKDPRITHHKNKISSFSPLSEIEISESWERYNSIPQYKDVKIEKYEERYICHKVRSRTLSLAINYVADKATLENFPDEYFEELGRKMNEW